MPSNQIPEDVRAELRFKIERMCSASGDMIIDTIAPLIIEWAIEQAAQVAERFVDHYPGDIFTPEGSTIDAQSARVIRLMAPAIANEIRAQFAGETGGQ